MSVTRQKSALVVSLEPMSSDFLNPDLGDSGLRLHTHSVTQQSEAEALLSKYSVDIIILNLHGSTCAWREWYAQLQRLHPRMARVIVADLSNRSVQPDAVSLAHSFISRRASRRSVIASLARILELQDCLASARLASLMSKLERLPTSKGVYGMLVAETNSPDATALSLSRIVETDIALTARVLQLINSSFFGLGKPVTSVHQALGYLGVSTIRSLAMMMQVHSLFPEAPLDMNRFMDMQKHGLLVGRLAKRLVTQRETSETALTAGILHDIGGLALLLGVPQASHDSRIHASQRHSDIDNLYGVNHTTIGAHLAYLWGLPDKVSEAIAWHHTPSRSPTQEMDALAAVHIADALVFAVETDRAPDLDAAFVRRIGVENRIPGWRLLAAGITGPASKTGRATGSASLAP